MQIVSPLLDGNGVPGTSGHLYGSNGAGTAPTWRAGTPFDRLSPFTISELALLATSTVPSLGRSYTTPGGGTTTMPTASGANLGQWASLRVLPGAAAIQTVTATTSTVGGRAAGDFKMWAGESVDLQSDGTNWLVRGGVCLPLAGGATAAAVVSCPNGAYTRIPLDTATSGFGGNGLMYGPVSGALLAPRKGVYSVTYFASMSGSSAGGVLTANVVLVPFVQINQATVGAPNPLASLFRGSGTSGIHADVWRTHVMPLNAGDYVHLGIYVSGAACWTWGSVSQLTMTEVPGW